METNFKVDVPSFALGYSAGKKKIPPAQEKEITVRVSGTTEVTPDEGNLLSKVTVNANFEGLELNVAYGEEPPEDTSKLWVKCRQPDKVTVISTPNFKQDITVKSETSSSSSSGLPNLPYRLYNAGAAVFGKTIYIFGGITYNEDTSATENTKKILAYDTETEKVRQLETEMPTTFTRRYGCWTIGEYIYMFSSGLGLARFDPTTEEIEILETPVELSGNYVGDNIGNKIYLANGKDLICLDLATMLVTSIGGVGISVEAAIAWHDRVYFTGTVGTEVRISCYDAVLGTATLVKQGLDVGSTLATFGGREIFITGDHGSSVVYAYDVYENKTMRSSVYTQTGSYVQYMVSKTVGDKWYILGGYASGSSGKYKYCYVVQRIIFPMGEVVAEPNELVLYPNETNGIESKIINGETMSFNLKLARYYIGDENGVGKPVDAYVYNNGEWQLAYRRYK